MARRVPQARADDGAGALEINFVNRQHRDTSRASAFVREAIEQRGLRRNHRPAIDPQRGAGAGDQEQQRHPGVADDIAQRIDPVVAAPVGQQQRRAVVCHPDKPGQITARTAIQPLRPDRRQRRKGRSGDQPGVIASNPVGDLDCRRLHRCIGIQRLKRSNRFNHNHVPFYHPPRSCHQIAVIGDGLTRDLDNLCHWPDFPQRRCRMATMNVSLPDALREWVETKVTDSDYASVSDYVRALLRQQKDHEAKLASLRLEVRKGIESGVSNRTFDDVLADVRAGKAKRRAHG